MPTPLNRSTAVDSGGGPYSICRHPLYVRSLLLGISAGLFLESPLLLIALLVVSTIYVSATVPVEEAVLLSEHGYRYELYARRVPRYRLDDSQSGGDHRRRAQTLARICAYIAMGLVANSRGRLTHLRTLAWWPRIFCFF